MRYSIGLILLAVMVWGSSCKDEPDPPVGEEPYITTPFDLYTPPSLPPIRVPVDNELTVEGVELGRMLFYDPILSADSTQSCGSCHEQSFAFTDNGKSVSTGIRNLDGRRNSMPIFNLMWHNEGFFWDGRANLLRHQAVLPIQDPLEMDHVMAALLAELNEHPDYSLRFKQAYDADEITEDLIGKALEQFMLTLVSGTSKFDIGQTNGFSNFTAQEQRGMFVFNQEAKVKDSTNVGGDCFHCHMPPLFMVKGFINNGLDTVFTDLGRADVTANPNDEGTFKTPSLRNVEHSAPYMHDGRFETLEEVVEFYLTGAHANSPNISANMHALQDDVYLSDDDKAALVSFLKTLTDETYLNNTDYSNPFN